MTSAPTPKPYLTPIQPYKAGETSKAAGVTPIKLSSNENPYGASPKAI
jgi:histidinol-phosphate aminotransferase